MASWLSTTNHKLYQCRLMLAQAAGSENPVLAEALEQGALQQLSLAYRCYLHELAELAQYRNPVVSLDQLLANTPLVTGEMRELEYLQRDSFSWLAQMLLAEAQLLRIYNPAPAVSAPAAGIELLATDSQDGDMRIDHWLKQLESLIDTQRGNRQES